MSFRSTADDAGALPRGASFYLYVEGPRDRAILECWAQRLSPGFARALVEASVILGGRQPARAAAHLRERRAHGEVAHGLCVLDGDDHDAPDPPAEPGLELFTWSRRHIESYLLVPRAIRAALRLPDDDAHFERSVRDLLPDPDDEAALRKVDAKQLLGPKGPLARVLGRTVDPSRVAKAMRAGEIHPEIHALFARIRRNLDGVAVREADPPQLPRRSRGRV